MAIHPSAHGVILPFGKYKGLSLAAIYQMDAGYLRWMSNAEKMSPEWKALAAKTLRGENLESTAGVIPTTKYTATVTKSTDKTCSATFTFDQYIVEQFKYKIDGSRWNSKKNRWDFPVGQLLNVVELFGGKQNIIPDDGVKALFAQLAAKHQELDTLHVSEDAQIEVPTKIELFPYQKVAIQFATRAGGRAMIADMPGLGKTLSSIGYAEYHGLKTLVVCPKSVKLNWRREIVRATGEEPALWDSKNVLGNPNGRYHIINYDVVEKRFADLSKEKFDLLIADEATALKNRKSKRTKTIMGAYREPEYPGLKTKHVLLLTGTPIMNRPQEAYTLLSFLDRGQFSNYWNFTQRYGGHAGEAPRNLDELHKRTKSLVIRRKKSDIMSELPEKQRNDVFIELSSDEMRGYKRLLDDVLGKWSAGQKPTLADMPKLQSYLSEIKLERTKEMVDEMLDNGRPVIIFSCWLNPLHELKNHYGEQAVMITGEMSADERQRTLNALISGTAKIGLFSIRAAAMGIDGLQQVIDTAIFLDMDWVPANHEQAEDRLHRRGQTGQVQIFYMICADTIDEYMRQILKDKQEVADMIVDGKIIPGKKETTVFQELLKKLSVGSDD